MCKKYDVVVIGSGICGSMLAYKLATARHGLSILMLEAGADRTEDRIEMALSYAGSINKGPVSPYDKNPSKFLFSPNDNKDFEYDSAKSTFKSTYLKIGGGTTWHFLGNVPRFLPKDFRLYSEYRVGVDWPISYDDLEKYYGMAESEMGVSGNHDEWNDLYGAYRTTPFPMPEIWPAYSDSVIKNRIEGKCFKPGYEIKARSTPQARNSHPYQGRPACAGNSSCVPICPIGAKYDGTVHIKKALKAGVEIRYKSVVFKIEAHDNGTIKCVHFRDWESKTERFVEADHFVLATHAIESALILLESKVANSSELLGKNLMDHPQGYGVGLIKEPVYPFRGPPTTSGIDVFRDGDFRTQYGAFRISLGNDGWGRWKGNDNIEKLLKDHISDENLLIGSDLVKALEAKFVRAFRFSYSTEMLPSTRNYVTTSATRDPQTGLPKPKIKFELDEYSKNAFEAAWRVMDFMFTELEAEQVGIPTNREEFSGAGHIMGTTKMGFNKSEAVVDKNCRAFDNPNLFIVGPGVFPTAGTANPTLTSAALALRLAEFLANQYEK